MAPQVGDTVTRRVLVRNGDLDTVGELDQIAGDDATLRLGAVGGWSLTCAAGSPAAQSLFDAHAGIRVEIDDRRLFAGRIGKIERSGGRVAMTGADDLHTLSGLRVADGTAFTGVPAEEAATQILAANLPRLGVPHTVAVSQGRGDQVTGDYEREQVDVLTAVRELLGPSGLWVDVTDDDSQLVVAVRGPRDRTDHVVFADGGRDGSDLGTVATATRSRHAAEADVVRVFGSDAVGLRSEVDRSDGRWRRETAIDVDGTTGEIDAKAPRLAADQLDDLAASESLAVTVAPVQAFGWGSDGWLLGDQVTVRAEGLQATTQIRELRLTAGRLSPVPADARPRSGLASLERLDRLERQVGRLRRTSS